MANRLATVMLVLALAAAAIAPAWAQSEPGAASDQAPAAVSPDELDELRRARADIALFHYGGQYAMNVVLGVIGGGLVMGLLGGGRISSTVTGSVIGALIGIWWFLDDFAATFVERHEW